jgi:hypothetical protein
MVSKAKKLTDLLEVYVVNQTMINHANREMLSRISHGFDSRHYKVVQENRIKTVVYGDVGGQPMKITIEPFMV